MTVDRPPPALEDVPTTVLPVERAVLGEGPAYEAASDTAWWFDIVRRRLFEVRLDTMAVRRHDLPFMASALAYADDGTQLLATERGLYLRRIADGRLTLYLPLEHDNPRTRSNDSRVHPSGTFWVGTMGCAAEPGMGAIYALRDGAVQRLYAGITIPNAICFSPDGATGYFADTRANTLWRVPLDPATGLPAGEPVAIHRPRGAGALDGAVVDADGLIWCARWGGACVDVYTPAGDRVRAIRAPALQVSCPVFVGADFDRLLVTSAHDGMDEAARAADPAHGQTFLLDVAGRGRPEPRVRLRSA